MNVIDSLRAYRLRKRSMDQLRRERQRKIESTAIALVDNKPDNRKTEKNLDWINAATSILETENSTSFRRLRGYALGVVLLCAVLSGILVSCRVPTFNVAVSIKSESVEMQLNEPWLVDVPLAVQLIHLEQLTQVRAPALEIDQNSELRDTWLEVEGPSLFLMRLEATPLEQAETTLTGSVRLEMYGGERDLEFFSSGNSLSGGVSAGQQSNLLWGEGSDTPLGTLLVESRVPEVVDFYSHGRGAAPTHLRLKFLDDWHLRGPNTHRLQFLRREVSPEGEEVFRSAIQSGVIQILDFEADPIQMHPGDHLLIEGEIELRRLELTGDQLIHVRFEGEVDDVRVGPEGFERHVAPRLLVFLYHNQLFSLVFVVVGLLSGLLWGIREVL